MRNFPSASAWIAGGLFALVAFGAAGCDRGSEAAPASTADPAASTQPATDGGLTFNVTGWKCGVKTIGPADLTTGATTPFCLVDVSVKNVGDKAALLDGGAQRAVDAQGKEYPVADLATVYLNDKDPSLLEQIEPGADVKGVLPFQVASGTQLSAIVLHAAKSTPGVRIALP